MEIRNPSEIWRLSFAGEWPTSVTFCGSNHRIAAADRAGRIFVWELPGKPPEAKPDGDEKEESEDIPPDLGPLRRLDGHSNAVTGLIASHDGQRLISASLDRTIRIWDLNAAASGTDEIVLDMPSRERRARRKPAEEKKAILQAPGTTVETLSSSHTLDDHKDWIRALGISANGKRLISGDDSCRSIVWDLDTLKPVSSWYGYDRVWVTSAALSPDGRTAFVGEYAGRRSSFDVPAAQARIWNADTGEMTLDLLKVWTPDVKDEDRTDSYGYGRHWGKLIRQGLVCADFSPDGKLLAAGQGGEKGDGQVLLVDVESGKIKRTVSGHRSGACDVKFSGDGRFVLSSGRDTTVRICQVSDGKEVAALGEGRGGQFKDWLSSIAISPDQQFIAAADIAGMVRVWRLKT